MYTPKPGTTQ